MKNEVIHEGEAPAIANHIVTDERQTFVLSEYHDILNQRIKEKKRELTGAGFFFEKKVEKEEEKMKKKIIADDDDSDVSDDSDENPVVPEMDEETKRLVRI